MLLYCISALNKNLIASAPRRSQPAAMFAKSASRSLASASNQPLSKRFASSIALKYSNALYGAALSKNPQTLTKVQAELAAISQSIKDTPALNSFVTNPTLSTKDRTAGLDALFKAASTGRRDAAAKEPISDITKNFFAVLSENGRLSETPGVIEGFNELVSKYKGELEVIVTSASPLPRDVFVKLESTLKQSQAAQQAKSLKVTNKVNPSVLGGIVVDFGDKTIDLSVSSRVNRMNTLLQESV